MTDEELVKTGLSDEELSLEAEKAAIANLERELPLYEAKIVEIAADMARIDKHIAYLETMKQVMLECGWKPIKPTYEFETDERFLEAKNFMEDVKMLQEINAHKQLQKQLELQDKLVKQEIERIKKKLGLIPSDEVSA
jgi:hypothetical protein